MLLRSKFDLSWLVVLQHTHKLSDSRLARLKKTARLAQLVRAHAL